MVLELVSQKYTDDGTISLVFTEFGTEDSVKVPVINNPRCTVLYIPLVNQLTMNARSRDLLDPVDLLCTDDDAAWATSNACKQFQPIRFSQVCYTCT